MSLLVWLPLNGNLNNNGLNNVTVTNSSSTVSDNGKIGKCYSFSGSSQKLTSTLPSSVPSSIGSLACWVKFNAFPANGKWMCLMQLGTSGGYASCRFGMYMEYTNGINICVDGSTTAENLYTHSLSTDTWYHLCTTYDGTDVKLYLNGEIVLSKSVTKGTYTSSATSLFIGGTNNYYLNGYLNDVRYYDHALSSKEVKEISRGLILHYPMTGGCRFPENLACNTHNMNQGASASNRNIAKYGGYSTIQLRDDGFYESKCTGQWSGIYANAASFNFQSGDVITYSFYAYTDGYSKTLSFYPMMFDSSGTRTTSVKMNISVDGGSYTSVNSKSFGSISNADPKRHYVTFVWNNDVKSLIDDGGYIHLSIQLSGSDWTDRYACIFGAKLEYGTKPTHWIPNFTDSEYTLGGYNNSTEYDVSGYHRDGTISGTIEYVTDTPRNDVCSNLIDPAYITYKLPANMYYATYAFWMKAHSFTTYGAIHMQAGSPSGGYSPWFSANTESGSLWMYLGGNSPNYCKASGSLSVDTWYHCAMVWDNGVAQWYLNGEKSGNAVTFTTKKYIDNSTNSTIGDSYTGSSWNGTPFTGQISDWRVYATALSATDIKQLYEETKSHK